MYELTFVVTSSSSAAGVPKIVVFLSDGEQMVLEACTNDIATIVRDGGVTMMSVGRWQHCGNNHPQWCL